MSTTIATTEPESQTRPRHSLAAIELRTCSDAAALAAWAERYLADLPTIVTFDEREVELLDHKGRPYRRAGYVIASPGDRDRFRIHLRRGATRDDLEFFRNAITWAKAGDVRDYGWKQNAAGHLVFRVITMHHPDPLAEVVVECDEPVCMESWHYVNPVDDPSTWVEHVHGEIERDGHLISVRRESGADEWTVHLETERGTGMTPTEVASLVNDLTWCRGDVLRLNAQRRADGASR